MKLLMKMLYEDLHTFYMKGENQKHKGDAGLDLFFPCEYLVPGKASGFLLGLGVACEPRAEHCTCNTCIPSGYELFPRSSIGKTPLRLANSIGLIDPGYRGEIMVMVDNISDEPFVVEKGTRLFQLVAPNRKPIEYKIVNELSETSRGQGGHGSTGK